MGHQWFDKSFSTVGLSNIDVGIIHKDKLYCVTFKMVTQENLQPIVQELEILYFQCIGMYVSRQCSFNIQPSLLYLRSGRWCFLDVWLPTTQYFICEILLEHIITVFYFSGYVNCFTSYQSILFYWSCKLLHIL